MFPLPAHQTKHLSRIRYPLPCGTIVDIDQIDSLTDSTGRTVWLGAQILLLYLHEWLKSDKVIRKDGTRKRVIDLGAGTGLLSISLAHEGLDVLATDIDMIADGVLSSNILQNPTTNGATLHSAALDWFAPPATWDFTCSRITPSSSSSSSTTTSTSATTLVPPFDYIVTSDSVYSSSLSTPLLSTLHALSTPPHHPLCKSAPPIFLCLERRDSLLVDAFIESATQDWGFKCVKIDQSRIARLVEPLGWSEEDWEGVEIWKLKSSGKKKMSGARELANGIV